MKSEDDVPGFTVTALAFYKSNLLSGSQDRHVRTSASKHFTVIFNIIIAYLDMKFVDYLISSIPPPTCTYTHAHAHTHTHTRAN